MSYELRAVSFEGGEGGMSFECCLFGVEAVACRDESAEVQGAA